MNWYLEVIKKYAVFNERARRREYWLFILFNVIFTTVAVLLDNILNTTIGRSPYGVFYLLYGLFVFIPSLAVLVRRLHDIGKSGWMIFIALIPVAGTIWLLVLLVTDSQAGENQYGPNPKQAGTAEIKDSSTDIILFLIVIWMVAFRLTWGILNEVVVDFFSTTFFRYLNLLAGLIFALVPIGLALAVKNKAIQLTMFILGGLYLVYGIYESIRPILQ